MRAAFMTGVNEVEVRDDVAEPKLDPAGALLRVEACGICGTDARTFFNGDPKAAPPWQLGHEPVGILEEVGPGADLPDGVAQGDRVFLGSILIAGAVIALGIVPATGPLLLSAIPAAGAGLAILAALALAARARTGDPRALDRR